MRRIKKCIHNGSTGRKVTSFLDIVMDNYDILFDHESTCLKALTTARITCQSRTYYIKIEWALPTLEIRPWTQEVQKVRPYYHKLTLFLVTKMSDITRPENYFQCRLPVNAGRWRGWRNTHVAYAALLLCITNNLISRLCLAVKLTYCLIEEFRMITPKWPTKELYNPVPRGMTVQETTWWLWKERVTYRGLERNWTCLFGSHCPVVCLLHLGWS